MRAGTVPVRQRARLAGIRRAHGERRPVSVTVLIAANLIEGIGGLAGAALLLTHPNGTAAWPVSWLDRFPFRTFVVPGLVLATALGAAPIIVAYGLWTRPSWAWTRPFVAWTGRHWSWLGAELAGVAVVAWMGVEVTLTPIRSAGMQIPIGTLGVAMVLLPTLETVRRWTRA